MRVDPLNCTLDAEQLVLLAARNDYYSGYVGRDDYDDIMIAIEGDNMDEKEKNLIWKLLDRGHYGPFEHPQITFAIEGMSRSCMAQITRHRFCSFDVQSQRYCDFSSDSVEDSVVIPKSLTDPEHFSRELGLSEVDEELMNGFRTRYLDACEDQFALYESLVNAGVPKEDARFVLPEGTKVNVVVSMNLRTLLHIVNMRGKGDAQWEVRQLADIMKEVGQYWAPRTFEWYETKGPLREAF